MGGSHPDPGGPGLRRNVAPHQKPDREVPDAARRYIANQHIRYRTLGIEEE